MRASHAELDKVLKPIGDDFWKTYYTPNGWNCRCTVTQESSGKIDKKEYPSDGIADPLFSKNWAAEGVVFPPGHPYFNEAPKSVLDTLSKNQLSNAAFHREGEVTENGGAIWVSAMADRAASDFDLIMLKAKQWADKGDIVQIMPRIDTTLKNELYPIVFHDIPKKYFGKCPDLKRNLEYWEHEGYITENFNIKSTVHNMIKRGIKQADNLILTFPADITDDQIKGRLENYQGPKGKKIEWIKKPG